MRTSQTKPIEYFTNKIILGDSLKVLKTIPSESIDCVITSPPYWGLRDYGVFGQIGLEPSLSEYLEKMITVFDEIKRVLKPSGTCFVNFGDTFENKRKGSHEGKAQFNFGIKPKSLCLIPTRFAVKMIERGWILRNEIIWHKPNAMPQSSRDRFTVDFEKMFFFVKSEKYYFKQQFEELKNPERIKRRLINQSNAHKQNYSYWFSDNPEVTERRRLRTLSLGRNKRCVWTIGTTNFKGNHFAVFPEKLVETPILAGCPENCYGSVSNAV
jgi:DNA modification methylase